MSAPASSSRPRPGTELELTVDRLAYGGKGVARLGGYVVFVAGGLPGDRVLARVEKSKRAYAEARAIEVITPSPDRLEPVADHPGAPWQVLPYERQLAEKEAQVRDALARIGGLDEPPVEPVLAAEVSERLPGLSPPELRKVRDYERRNANRKSLLAAIERQLK